MNIFEIVSIDLLEQRVKEYLSKRTKYCNYYMNSLEGMMFAEGSETLLLKKPYKDFNRIYYFSSNKDELIESLSLLDKSDAINIPGKMPVSDDVQDVLRQGGYHLSDIYERMIKIGNDDIDDFNGRFAKSQDAEGIYKLLYDNFNPIPDRLATKEEIITMISNNEILVNYDDKNQVNGLIMWTLDGKMCNFHAWICKASVGESLDLFQEAFNYIGSKGIKRSTLWVNINNISAKKIYEMMEYKYDGLKDYTFLKTT